MKQPPPPPHHASCRSQRSRILLDGGCSGRWATRGPSHRFFPTAPGRRRGGRRRRAPPWQQGGGDLGRRLGGDDGEGYPISPGGDWPGYVGRVSHIRGEKKKRGETFLETMFFFWSSRCWCSYFFHGEIEGIRSRWEIFRWRWFSIVHVTRSHVNWHAYSFLSCSIHMRIKNFNTYKLDNQAGTPLSFFIYYFSNIFSFQISNPFVAWKKAAFHYSYARMSHALRLPLISRNRNVWLDLAWLQMALAPPL